MIKSNVKISGMVHIYLWDSIGDLKAERHVQNIITDIGVQHIADRMSGLTETVMGYIAIGSDYTAVDAGDTTLGNELARKACSVAQLTGSNAHKVRYTANFPAGTGTGVVYEAGILNAASGGALLCHVTFDKLRKSSYENITFYWDIAYTSS